MSTPPKILSVGQCSADHGSISRSLARSLDARVSGVDTASEALDALRAGPYDLVLVNRVGDLDGAPGLALIGALKADATLSAVPVMLVSNYPDAQAEAEALGAFKGFGKADLGTTKANDALRAALGGDSR